MQSACNKKCIHMVLFILLTYFISITPAAAIGEASTSLYVYVPPGGSGSHATATYIVVTAISNDTVVDIIDLDSTVGDPTNKSSDDAAFPVVNESDPDLSEYNVHLDMGQSRVIKVSYNESAPDSDGAYFHVSATRPVTVYTGTAEGRHQADFVPGNNGTMVGNSFFVYLPDCSDAESPGRFVYDLAVFPFEDNTNVSVYNISSGQTLVEMKNQSQLNATTSIDFSSATLVANEILYPNTPNRSLNRKPTLYLQALNGSGIERGYTYLVITDKSVSVASVGILNDNKKDNMARDGAYQVPGISDNPYRSGTGLAHTFYIQLNGPKSEEDGRCCHKGYDYTIYENEIYLINQNTTSTAYVTIEEFNPTAWKWEKIPGDNISGPNDGFIVTNSNITGIFSNTTKKSKGCGMKWDNVPRYNHQGLVRVTSNDSSGKPMDISVFAGVWMETNLKDSHHGNGMMGDSMTGSDIAAFTSGDTGYGASTETILYVPPPGEQPFFNNTPYTHVYIYVHHNNTNITVQSWNSTNNDWQSVYSGNYTNITKDQIIDYRINSEQWDNGTDRCGCHSHIEWAWDFRRVRVLSSERVTVQVSNWNDNWASYVPGGTPPEFTARISVQSRYLTINSIPAPRVRYSFDVTNGAIGNIGTRLFNLSVINSIPDGIDQRKIIWSINSSKDGFLCDINSDNQNISEISGGNGTKYIWNNATNDIEVTAYAYSNGNGTIFKFTKAAIDKNEILTFRVNSPLNATYHNGTLLQSDALVIDVGARAENPFLGEVSTRAKPGVIILNHLIHGVISLF